MKRHRSTREQVIYTLREVDGLESKVKELVEVLAGLAREAQQLRQENQRLKRENRHLKEVVTDEALTIRALTRVDRRSRTCSVDMKKRRGVKSSGLS